MAFERTFVTSSINLSRSPSTMTGSSRVSIVTALRAATGCRRVSASPTLADEPGQGRVWQYLDLARYRESTGMPVRDWIVQQTSDAADGLVREWPRPDAGIDRHRGYAFQWYSLAGLSFVMTAAYVIRRLAT